MSASSRTVAFSTVEPLLVPAAAVRRHPARVVVPIAALLAPLPVLAAVAWQLVVGAAGAPLQIALAGFPPPAELLLPVPGADAWRAFAALVVVGVAMVAAVVGAGLVGGAAAQEGSARDGLALALRRGPAAFAVLFVQLLAAAAAVTVVLVAAWLAGQLRFQLQPIVALAGCVALAVGAARLSLWPALVVRERRGYITASAESWILTRGSTTRLLAAGAGVAVAVAVPALVLRWAVTATLTALAGAGHVVASPITIDLLGLAVLPPAFAVAVAVWGCAAPSLVASLRRWTPPRDGADQRRAGG